jgi:hypothetical protein
VQGDEETSIVTPWRQKTREKLASLAHEQWAGWVEWMLSRLRQELDTTVCACGHEIDPEEGACHECGVKRQEGVIDGSWTERWERQIETPYKELSEPEKDSDRAEADKVLEAIGRQAEIAFEVVEAVRDLVEWADTLDLDALDIEGRAFARKIRQVERLLVDYDVAECQ